MGTCMDGQNFPRRSLGRNSGSNRISCNFLEKERCLVRKIKIRIIRFQKELKESMGFYLSNKTFKLSK